MPPTTGAAPPMTAADYLVLLLYAAGIVGVGVFLSTQVRSSKDLFAAGGRSPWWVSGLSGFMTMFSAGTFVVWGGIAYRYGLVAVSISLCYGIAALFVGWTIAGRWRRLGVDSAAEYLQLRFGRSIVQLYTWAQGLLLIFTLGGTIYALSTVVCELIVLPPGIEDTFFAFLRRDLDGTLSVTWTSGIVLFAVVIVTLVGGLWAVLVTDVLQFIVLTASVLFVVPLILHEVGGIDGFIDSARQVQVPTNSGKPANLLSPVSGNFTWWFLLGWVIVHYAKIGGEWAFAQRFLCVPSPKDARKSAWIFGVMYLVSPLFWMLPAMVYRIMQPIPEGLPPDLLAKVPPAALGSVPIDQLALLNDGLWSTADPALVEGLRTKALNAISERAYINACRAVLPPGMIGLMIAAMISATASMATTQLNVYAQAFTQEVYRLLFNPNATDRRLVFVGRVMTLLLGCVTLAGALIIPSTGSYTGFIIAVTGALTFPLVLPTVWSLFSPRIGLAAAWTATVVGVIVALLAKFGLQGDGAWFADVETLAGLRNLVNLNTTVSDWVIGLAVPLACLLVFELTSNGTYPGWERTHAARTKAQADADAAPPVTASPLPAIVSGWTVVAIAVLMIGLAIFGEQGRGTLAVFAFLMGTLGTCILLATRWAMRKAAATDGVTSHG